jgi:16S rRNA (guanine1207-N2)-methyltransferase
MLAAHRLLYGIPPESVIDDGGGCLQCSPLIPGSDALELMVPQSAGGATIYAPSGTLERRYTLALALRALHVQAPLVALAPNDKGGGRLADELAQFGCKVTESSRKHHRIVSTKRPSTLVNMDEAIAAGASRKHPIEGLWTQPGIFSWDRIDEGSALLLRHLPTFSGHGADLGCGLGILSRQVLASPTVNALTLIDLDRRAIEAAARNIADARATFHWKDACQAPDKSSTLDFIVMNPPFHHAGIEDKSLGQRFILAASNMLKPAGVLWCVANRHLPYEDMINKYFSSVKSIAEENGYKVICATRNTTAVYA